MRRSDAAGLRHFALWAVLLLGSLVGVLFTWRTWACLPFLAVYGVMYSMSDHHAHELSHGTPFKNRLLNEALYQLSAFMTLHESHYWRWSHTFHHTNTLIVGQDPEVAVKRPPQIWRVATDFFFLPSGLAEIRKLCKIAFSGSVSGDALVFVPSLDQPKVVRGARVYLALFTAVGALCVAFKSGLPALLIVTPRFWGGPFAQLFNITQHAGLPENVRDHRLNCRTVLLNPVSRFLYANMNFHVEHHMFPMVPFHALPALHAEIRDQCVAASPSVSAAWRELLPAIRRQVTDPVYSLTRSLPVP